MVIIVIIIIFASCLIRNKENGESSNGIENEIKDKEFVQEEMVNKVLQILDECRDIYLAADKGEASNVVLGESVVHDMVEKAAESHIAVTCGSHDYNMLNYQSVHNVLLKAKNGESVETEFLEITTSGVFRYEKLEFNQGKMILSSVVAAFDESLQPVIRQKEKLQVYKWEYTEKGWLILEKALSKNQEMDMHVFYRVLPLDEKSREITKRCIEPISYFCNNLFVTDWNESSLDEVEFNDLFEFLYQMETGRPLDENVYANELPKTEFESVIQKYFDISVSELEQYARYDAKSGMYPWYAIGKWNRIQQFQPFPEVVKCIENEDGTISVYVDAVFVEEGTDRSFGHVVTIREKENGEWVYLGNVIDWENAKSVPDYLPRREYAETEYR